MADQATQNGALEREVAVEFDHVSKRFTLYHDRPRSFQEWMVGMFRRAERHEEMWALRDVSFRIGRGEVVAFIGSNGAGKSSLLKLVSGILAPTEGAVRVNGRISGLLELGAGFHPDLTGRENVYLNGSILGLDRREVDRLFPAIVRFAEMEAFIDMPVKHYSSGMYMRLGFAVAIHSKPDILLVDEVLAVGDAAFQAKCLNRILDLKKRGATILFVSHDLDSVRKLCNRAIWIDRSRVRAEGPPAQVIAAYLDKVAAQQLADRAEEDAAEAVAAAPAADNRAADTVTPNPPSPTPSPSSGARWGTRQVEITAVECLGADGQPSDAFDTDAPFCVRIHYDAHQPIEHPMFGIAIHHEEGAHVSGPNTVYAGFDIPRIHGVGYVDYAVDALPLLAGQYTLTAAIYDHWETGAYDHHDQMYRFRVRPGHAERYGLVTLNGRWSATVAEVSTLSLAEDAP